MTATGIALIAGGLATLICFRRLLWSGHRRRRGLGAAQRRAARTPAIAAAPPPAPDSGSGEGRRPERLPAQPGAPDISGAHLASVVPALNSRRGRRRGRQAAPDDDERAGLASIGFADEDPERSEAPQESHVDTEPPAGDYWMPVPESAYADLDSADHDEPVRTDRARDVESEPTAVVPTWPPARPFDRIELPRIWSDGPGVNQRALRDGTGWNASRGRMQHTDEDRLDWDGRDGWRRDHGPEDDRVTLHGVEPRRRPRPRPNPTVYVSRHAAE